MLMFQGDTPPTPPLIQIVIEEKIETPKEPTLEEKIATNYYKCDETRQYIRADTADCLDKPQYRASTQRSSTSSTNTSVTTQNAATAPEGWYDYHSCTWHVWSKRSVGKWGNASQWYWQAQKDGWTTGTTPVAGAIGWTSGHVVYIESVDGNQVYISERNYDYNGSYRERWADASDFKYIY